MSYVKNDLLLAAFYNWMCWVSANLCGFVENEGLIEIVTFKKPTHKLGQPY